MKVIGLTGVFGSGKSTIARMLTAHGYHVIDADHIGHKLLLNSRPVRKKVLKTFGTTQRKNLGELVFSDRRELIKLNKIMHPTMKRIIKQELKRAQKAKELKGIVIEAAVLAEMMLAELVDEIWLVTASKNSIMSRMRGSMSITEIKKRLANASSLKKMIKTADLILKNDTSMTELLKKVQSLL